MGFSELESNIKSGKRCHLIGIGGVSVSALAEVLLGLGLPVTGSDSSESKTIEKLRKLGIPITIGHKKENLINVDFIIRTAAVRENNIEIETALDLGIPVFERAEVWGYIMSKYKNAICVSGVHGKTSTTSMITHVLLEAGLDPTVMIGGNLPILNSGYRLGKGDVIALESCEYYNSFHFFRPTIAVILNVDADHLDFFSGIDELIHSFRKFASLVPEDGFIVCNGDDANTVEALIPLKRNLLTFGFGQTIVYTPNISDPDLRETPIRIRGVNFKSIGRNPSMDVLYDNKPLCKITLQIPGVHNLRNALAAVAVSIAMGIDVDSIEKGLYSYKGVSRRFDFKCKINGADVYDDYAHHPSELRATLNAASTLGYERIILVFQPHTFSRTKALFYDFVTELSRPDLTYLAPIYSAREIDDLSISSDVLAGAIHGARCIKSMQEIADDIKKIARPGDIIITAGAGDIYKVGDILAASVSKTPAAAPIAKSPAASTPAAKTTAESA